MAAPTFDIVPIITDRDGIHVGAVIVYGLSTKSDSKSEGGKLYVDMVVGGGYSVSVYSDYARAVKVMEGATDTLGAYFALTAVGASGLTGRMRLDGSGEPKSAILLPTLNLDTDIFQNATYPLRFPGYDATYGLAAFHAAAMRRLFTSDLPAALPNLYHGSRVSAFVPLSGGELPDLSEIAAPDALRDAHLLLTKHLAARAASHIEEFSEIAASALDEYTAALAQLTAANAPAEDEAKGVSSAVAFGEFIRG